MRVVGISQFDHVNVGNRLMSAGEKIFAAEDPLDTGLYSANPQSVARKLLGRLLVSVQNGELTSGIVVETESYLAVADSACHAARGRTRKTDVMFGPCGIAYVYPIHAKYCFNVVTENPGRPSAVLIRAIEPIDGIEVMQRRRQVEAITDLARGPARLCQAMGIGREHNGLDLTIGQRIWIESKPLRRYSERQIRLTPRVGVTTAQDLLLRYVVAGNRFVSGPKRLG